MKFERAVVFCIALGTLGSLAYGEEAKTFPGASVILPAVLPIIGTIIPALLPGGPPPPSLPGVSVSHATSVATSGSNGPIAISHSGSVSTSGNTNAGATATTGSSLSAQSSSGTSKKSVTTSPIPGILMSRRWRKFFQNLG
ncbi:uncharacterized protein LOC128272591 [Anopheles cruzii]|uniref:uncharacterized protein LOC128272591 n=1 Tax=Anopheles cruzii TaxID=68878 RepID=UPI0022EC786B|nr:uncharacterized protein LOC128272591 [Anopheles cruzii]